MLTIVGWPVTGYWPSQGVGGQLDQARWRVGDQVEGVSQVCTDPVRVHQAEVVGEAAPQRVEGRDLWCRTVAELRQAVADRPAVRHVGEPFPLGAGEVASFHCGTDLVHEDEVSHRTYPCLVVPRVDDEPGVLRSPGHGPRVSNRC